MSRVTEVRYEQVQNLGNYENRRVGVTMILGEDEQPQAVLDAARAFVTANLPDPYEEEERRQAALREEVRAARAAGPDDGIPF